MLLPSLPVYLLSFSMGCAIGDKRLNVAISSLMFAAKREESM